MLNASASEYLRMSYAAGDPLGLSTAAVPDCLKPLSGYREQSAATSGALVHPGKFRLPKSAQPSPKRRSEQGHHRRESGLGLTDMKPRDADLERNEVGARGCTKKR